MGIIVCIEPEERGHGYGRESVLIILQYGINELGVKRFEAKIGFTNSTSLQLFESIGFQKVRRSDVFQEVTLELVVRDTLCQTWPTYESVLVKEPSGG